MKALLFVIALCAFVQAGCDSALTTPQPGTLVGNVVGFVKYYDTSYLDYSDDIKRVLAGATITVEGTSFSATSDANGRWEIHGLPAGTYNVSCSKEGFTTSKTVGFKFVGNGTDLLTFLTMGKIPLLTPKEIVLRAFEPFKIPVYKDTFYIYTNGDTIHYLVVADSIYSPTHQRAVFSVALAEKAYLGNVYPAVTMFFAPDSNINPENPRSYGHLLDGVYNSSTSPESRFDFTFTTDTLQKKGFQSGQEIYCAVYAASYYNRRCGYIDLVTGKTCWTGFGPVRVVKKFILP